MTVNGELEAAWASPILNHIHFKNPLETKKRLRAVVGPRDPARDRLGGGLQQVIPRREQQQPGADLVRRAAEIRGGAVRGSRNH